MVGKRILLMTLGAVCLLTFVSAAFITIPAASSSGGTVTNCRVFHDGGGAADTLGELIPNGGSIQFGCSGTIPVPEMVIRTNTVLDGRGQMVTLSGRKTNRLFSVPAGSRLELIGLTLIEGYSGPGNGGAINNAGTLVIRNSSLSNHETQRSPFGPAEQIPLRSDLSAPLTTATQPLPTPTGDWKYVDPRGGAIYNTGSATLINSMISFNRAYRGGGIYNMDSGLLTISGSSLLKNQDTAIISSGILTIERSTLAYNGGRAITASGRTTIASSTISQNGTDRCGGISVLGDATIISSTLAYNSSAYDGNNLCGTARIANSLIAGYGYPGRRNCSYGPFIDLGFNLSTDDSCGISVVSPSQLNLAGLAYNGGLTMTHAFNMWSAAVDAGNCDVGYDQRGEAFRRPVDVPRMFNRGNGCDIGAYEYQLPRYILPVPKPPYFSPPRPTPTAGFFIR